MSKPETILTHNGESLPVREWARRKGISPRVIHQRVNNLGWSVAEAIDTPPRKTSRRGGRHKSGVPRPCPALKRHKTGRAYVRWKMRGRTFERYFGKWASADATAKYRRFAGDWALGVYERIQEEEAARLSVGQLALAFLSDASSTYVKDGRRTSEYYTLKTALRGLNDMYGDTEAALIEPAHLRAVRDQWVAAKLSRNTCNAYTSRIVRMFGWAVGRSLVPPAVHLALEQVEELVSGRTTAPDAAPRQPVSDADVAKTFEVIDSVANGPNSRAIATVQRLTGMRPGEACAMAVADLDRSADVWRYTVRSNKNRHRGKSQVYYLGPKAVAVLAPFVATAKDATAPLFGLNRAAYWRAIRTAAIRAGVAPWTPHQLRHSLATEVAGRFRTLEHAAAAIGDTQQVAAAVYVHIDPKERAKIEVARAMG